jgi:mRNA interferase MazF
MAATIETTIAIQQSLLDQANILAQQLNIPPNHLFEIALENFIKNVQDTAATSPMDSQSTAINQGDIFWIRPPNPGAAELGYYPHPYVVIQDNIFNHSRIHTVVVCALTSNRKQANAPGNVLLEAGEANLPRQSVVVVSKLSAVHKSQLGERIGSLNQPRTDQILAGIRFLHLSFFARQ